MYSASPLRARARLKMKGSYSMWLLIALCEGKHGNYQRKTLASQYFRTPGIDINCTRFIPELIFTQNINHHKIIHYCIIPQGLLCNGHINDFLKCWPSCNDLQHSTYPFCSTIIGLLILKLL